MIRNIIFDMGNVLIHFIPDVFLDRLSVPEEDCPLLLREVFGSVEWVQLDRGSIDEAEAVAAMQGRLPRRLRGYVPPLVGDWWNSGPLLPMEGMAGLLEELKGLGYGLYLLSNASVHLPDYFDRIPGSQLFDGKIVSADWKLLKPQHEIYEVLFRVYRLKPEECFFIDDLAINIEGALCTGMPGAIFYGEMDRLRRELNAAGVPVRA